MKQSKQVKFISEFYYKLLMEELLSLEYQTFESSQLMDKQQMGQSWQCIHSQMQQTLIVQKMKKTTISTVNNNSNLPSNSHNNLHLLSLSKPRAPILKEEKELSKGNNKFKKQELKLAIIMDKNEQLESRTCTERIGNLQIRGDLRKIDQVKESESIIQSNKVSQISIHNQSNYSKIKSISNADSRSKQNVVKICIRNKQNYISVSPSPSPVPLDLTACCNRSQMTLLPKMFQNHPRKAQNRSHKIKTQQKNIKDPCLYSLAKIDITLNRTMSHGQFKPSQLINTVQRSLLPIHQMHSQYVNFNDLNVNLINSNKRAMRRMRVQKVCSLDLKQKGKVEEYKNKYQSLGKMKEKEFSCKQGNIVKIMQKPQVRDIKDIQKQFDILKQRKQRLYLNPLRDHHLKIGLSYK